MIVFVQYRYYIKEPLNKSRTGATAVWGMGCERRRKECDPVAGMQAPVIHKCGIAASPSAARSHFVGPPSTLGGALLAA